MPRRPSDRRTEGIEVRRGELRGSPGPTLREAAVLWLEGAHAGSIRNRSGDHYKPSVLRGYEQALRLRLLPELGGVRLGELRRGDVQRLVDELLRAICRRAIARGEIAVNPTTGLELPAVRGRRDRIASREVRRDRAFSRRASRAG